MVKAVCRAMFQDYCMKLITAKTLHTAKCHHSLQMSTGKHHWNINVAVIPSLSTLEWKPSLLVQVLQIEA